jgi:hypothetical protein
MSRLPAKVLFHRFAKPGFLPLYEGGRHVGIVAIKQMVYVPAAEPAQPSRSRRSWARKSLMPGVSLDPDAQLRELRRLVAPFQPEYRGTDIGAEAIAGSCDPHFGTVDAQALHGFVRATRPRRVIAIGSGASTRRILHAARCNAADGHALEFTCIEPYPSAWLSEAPLRLIAERLEDVDFAVFDKLHDGDLLFVDSTCAVRIGGDVVRIVLEILPRLRPGVIVHFNDVFFPYDFRRDAERTLARWMATALVHAFLIFNRRVEILFCLSHLHHERPDALREVFPSVLGRPRGARKGATPSDRHCPSSLYLRLGRADDVRPSD